MIMLFSLSTHSAQKLHYISLTDTRAYSGSVIHYDNKYTVNKVLMILRTFNLYQHEQQSFLEILG